MKIYLICFGFSILIDTKKYVDPSQLEDTEANNSNEDDDDDNDDIEAQIKKEVESMKPAKRANNAPFQVIKTEVQCGMFIERTLPLFTVAPLSERMR